MSRNNWEMIRQWTTMPKDVYRDLLERSQETLGWLASRLFAGAKQGVSFEQAAQARGQEERGFFLQHQ